MIYQRYLLIKRGCPFCRKYLGIVEKLNSRIPIEKSINVIDVTDWEDFGILTDARILKIPYKGTPYLFIDGVDVPNSPTTRKYIEGFLNALLDENGDIKTYSLEEEYV